MMRRKPDLSTVYDVFVAAILLTIFMQINVQAIIYKKINLRHTYGSFSSPNYPSTYPSYVYYEWILPRTFHKLQIEFVELDLYNCYVKKRNRFCEDYDYVYIFSNGYDYAYCNWHRPTRPITFRPWTQGKVVFYSSDSSSAECRGRGFKAKYRPSDPLWHEPTMSTTTMTTRTMPTLPSTESSEDGQQSEKFTGTSFLLILLVLPLILVVACLYWSCRRSRRPTANQDMLQTTINNWNYQTDTPVIANARGHPVGNTNQGGTLLTVELPPTPRTGNRDGITQVRQPNSRGGYSAQRQTNANELPEMVAPPTYDEVWENDNLNHLHSQSFESPPSYEVVMRESRESLNQEPAVNRVDYTEPYMQ